MTHVYSLKSGKSYTAPSMFVNPQSLYDITALWKLDEKNSLTNIDGIYFRLADFKKIFKKFGFGNKPLVPDDHLSLRDKIRLMDPCLELLLNGMDEDRKSMLETGLFDNKIPRILRDISFSGLTNLEKSSRIIDEVYPLLHVRPIIEHELNHGNDMVISPCVNLSSKHRLRDKIEVGTRMLQNTRILLETSSLKKYKETRDVMNSVTIGRSVLVDERNFQSLFDLLLCNQPDHVGVKLDGFREDDSVALNIAFKFFRQFYEYAKHKAENKPPPPLHLINVDELGYASYCNAVSNIICPIARSPHIAFPSKKKSTHIRIDKNTSETYYHPIDMNTPQLKLQNPLPCACPECSVYRFAHNISKTHRPAFRRIHWLHVKDGEIKEQRETPVRIDTALRDKFARSMRLQLVAYLPTDPIFAVY